MENNRIAPDIAENMQKLLHELQEHGKICIYDDQLAGRFRGFLDTICFQYATEDVGGNPIAQMWRFELTSE